MQIYFPIGSRCMTLPIYWNQQTHHTRLQPPVSQNESLGGSSPTLLEGRLGLQNL